MLRGAPTSQAVEYDVTKPIVMTDTLNRVSAVFFSLFAICLYCGLGSMMSSKQTVRHCLGDWRTMKLFGFFGKSSDDEEVTNAEEATRLMHPTNVIRPNKHPPHSPQ